MESFPAAGGVMTLIVVVLACIYVLAPLIVVFQLSGLNGRLDRLLSRAHQLQEAVDAAEGSLRKLATEAESVLRE